MIYNIIMRVFEFSNYRFFLRSYIDHRPRNGRGEVTRLAQAAGVHPSLLSQILAQEKNLSLEQAQLIAEYIDLTINETEYFLFLVQFERAGTKKLKTYFSDKLKKLKSESVEMANTVRQDRQLTEEDKSIIYSHRIYLTIWLFTSIGDGKTLDEVAVQCEITREKATEILNFLVKTELCVIKNSKYTMGSQSIHIGRGSPHLYKHHANWRLKAIEASDSISAEELMYTAPMSMSKADAKKIRSRLADVIKEVTDIVYISEAEEVVYLGIDFFSVKS